MLTSVGTMLANGMTKLPTMARYNSSLPTKRSREIEYAASAPMPTDRSVDGMVMMNVLMNCGWILVQARSKFSSVGRAGSCQASVAKPYAWDLNAVIT